MQQFSLNGHNIKISKALESYNHYRTIFIEKGQTTLAEFVNLYAQNHSIEDVINCGEAQIEQCIAPAISYCVQELVDHGIYTYDEKKLEEEYEISSLWGSAFDKICDQYNEISMNEDEKNEYRRERRLSRRRWEGGGFGVAGAIKGATAAGAMNMVSGAGHAIVNSIGSMMSSIHSNHLRKELFLSEDTFQDLALSVYYTVYYLHYFLIDLLNKTGIDTLPIQGCPSEKEKSEAVSMLNNISRISDREQAVNVMIQILLKDPYNTDWYRTALNLLGDSSHELDKIANYFSIEQLADAKIQTLEEFAASLPLSSEEVAKESLSKIKSKQKYLGYEEDSPRITAVKQAVVDFDIAYRTVDGNLHDSRTAADESKRELNDILVIKEAVQQHLLCADKNFKDGISKFHYEKERLPTEDLTIFLSLEQNLRDTKTQVLTSGCEKISVFTSFLAQSIKSKWEAEQKELETQACSVQTFLPGHPLIQCTSQEEAQELQKCALSLIAEFRRCCNCSACYDQLTALQNSLDEENCPAALKECYLKEINIILQNKSAKPHVVADKKTVAAIPAEATQNNFQKFKEEAAAVSNDKEALELWQKIGKERFSDSANQELLDTELQKLKKTNRMRVWICRILLLLIIVSSIRSTFLVKPAYLEKDPTLLGAKLSNTHATISKNLGLEEGIKNGMTICGRSIWDNLSEAFHSYIDGFSGTILGKILWGILGIIYIPLKFYFLFFIRYAVTWFLLLTQKAGIMYYISYLAASYATFMVLVRAINGDKEHYNSPEEFKKFLTKKSESTYS